MTNLEPRMCNISCCVTFWPNTLFTVSYYLAYLEHINNLSSFLLFVLYKNYFFQDFFSLHVDHFMVQHDQGLFYDSWFIWSILENHFSLLSPHPHPPHWTHQTAVFRKRSNFKSNQFLVIIHCYTSPSHLGWRLGTKRL